MHMPDAPYQRLSVEDRRLALRVAEDASGRRGFLLEKDIWVVTTLDILFRAPFGGHLIFKGGTSLSKVWRAIHRFSGDVDIAHDIRAFAPDLVAGAGEEALPPTRSQQKPWTRAIRARLDEWVRDQASPAVEGGLGLAGFSANVRAKGDRLYVRYEPLFEETDFVPTSGRACGTRRRLRQDAGGSHAARRGRCVRCTDGAVRRCRGTGQRVACVTASCPNFPGGVLRQECIAGQPKTGRNRDAATTSSPAEEPPDRTAICAPMVRIAL